MNQVLVRSQQCFIFTMAFVALSALSYAQAVTYTVTGTLSSPPISGIDPLGFAGKSVTFVVAIDQSTTPPTHTQGQGFSSSTYTITSPNSVTFSGTACASSSAPSVTIQDLVPGPDYVGIANCHIGTGAVWAAIFTIPNGNLVTAAPASVPSSGVAATVQYTSTPGSSCPSPCITNFTLVGSLQATGAAPPAVAPSPASWSPSAPQGSTTAQSQVVTFTVSSPAVCSGSMTPSNPCVESYATSKSTSSCGSSWLSVTTNNTSPVVQGSGNTTTSITITADPTGISQSSCSGSISVIYRTGALGISTVIPVTLTLVPVSGPPSIFTQPANQTVTAGQTATFSVGATGTPPLSYQWQKNGNPITGATGSSYTTPPTTTTDNGATFTVTVTNSSGAVTSNPATLTVASPPSITTQPASQTVTAGQTATFAVAVSGSTPLSIQWQRNGSNIGGATSASYTTPVTITTDNGASFTAVVTNSLGSVTSSAAILTVNSPPAITTQPANQTVTAGQTATFTVVATGVPPPSYQWQKNGSPITGANAASYTTPATTTTDNGASFTVVVTNSLGSVTSTPAAILTVNSPPTITTQPANQTVTAGQTATFTVLANSIPSPTYQWQKNGVNIAGATSASYTTPPASTADNGTAFTVVVSNSVGAPVTSSPATLTVNSSPAITTQPANQTVTAGQAATFTVVATGVPAPTYQWQNSKVGTIAGANAASYTTPPTTATDDGTTFTVVVTNSLGSVTSTPPAILTVNSLPAITTQPANQTVSFGQTATFSVQATGTAPLSYRWQKNPGGTIAGATSASYTTAATTTADNGAMFTVTVTNSAGSVNSNPATLAVNASPTITTQPANQSVAVGQTATFTAAATGSAPLSYQWQKNGANIPGATATSYTTPVTTTADNGAAFTLVVTNSLGSVTSTPATLTVNTPPAITTQPANQTVAAGQTATFTVVASGTAPLSYQWQRNGTAIVGATGSTFTTGITSLDDGVAFTVMVTNSVGSVTSNPATLSVNMAPSITTQPSDQSVTAGQTATFSVIASGTPAPTYQWQKNGAPITGANAASYTTPATTATDSGMTFTVVASNVFGSVTSAPANLTVTASASTITATPSQLSFSYTINGAAPASQSLTLTSGATASFTLATSGGTWLTATPSSGSTPATITVSANTAGLAAGTYNGTITVTPGGASNSPVTASVQLTVNDASKITASPTQLSFVYVQGGAAPAAQTINLTGTSPFTAAATGVTWASATPASGTAPASLSVTVDPAGLNAGSYSASITVTSGSASDSPLTITVTLNIAAPLTGPAINAAFDAAGFDPDAFAPGSVVAIFGVRMGPDTSLAFTLNSQGKLDNSLAGVRVLVDGVPAIPLFVWKNQINAILPFTINTSGQAAVKVEYNGVTSPSFYIPLSAAGIRLFTADASGKGPGAILNRDGSLNSAANPADKGSIVSLFVAGGGLLDHPVTAGDVAGTNLYSISLPVSATVNGADATVFYAGSAPGLVYGVDQINVQLPADVPSGSQAITVTAGSSTSHSNVTVFVK